MPEELGDFQDFSALVIFMILWKMMPWQKGKFFKKKKSSLEQHGVELSYGWTFP